jgi:hypothetical protein
MPDDVQQDSGGGDGGQEGGDLGGQEGGGQSDDPGRIGLGTSIRGGNPGRTTRKAALDPDDPGPIRKKGLIQGR